MAMTVTQFLVENASQYETLGSLYKKARGSLLSRTEGLQEFLSLLEGWMAKYPDGILPGGFCYYTELAERGPTAKKAGCRIGSIMVQRMRPELQKHSIKPAPRPLYPEDAARLRVELLPEEVD
jgi:hypothetical protein